MISIQTVSKSFGRVQAVREVSLEIATGEFFSLLGASGSGKTTLLRMIAGFEGVSAGRILIDGREMQDMPPHLRPINMVFQNYAIFPHLNVRDNIAYGLRRLGTPKAEQARLVDEMLEMIALPGYGDRREQMQLELRGLQRQLGITFVLVTHDQEEALTLSDRVAVMAEGKVIQVDTPAGLYDHPKTRKVAAFVGSMNFFDALIRGEGEGRRADIAGLGQHRLNGQAGARRDGDRVLVAIRPESLILNQTGPAPTGPSVAGRVQARQYLGGRQILHVTVEGRAAPVAVSTLAHRGDDPWNGSEGVPVWLTWGPDAMTVMDPE
jgi:ABC-type Fe3+/spermidine/putrescine transport system ATPase subunit